jgi:hypothetical protein
MLKLCIPFVQLLSMIQTKWEGKKSPASAGLFYYEGIRSFAALGAAFSHCGSPHEGGMAHLNRSEDL